MVQIVEAVIDENGQVRLLESIHLPAARRALVAILEEDPALVVSEMTRLSEPFLAEDWNQSEEDAAWSHLQPGR